MTTLDRDRIGDYRIEQLLGRDELFTIYRGVHAVLPRRAVIKLMHEQPAAAGFGAVQLLREACMLDALQHPGIVRIYESGMAAARRPWFAAEHVEGPSLAELLAAGATIDRMQAVGLLRDLADVLEHAHRRGVIHRGLHPAHIVLAPRPAEFPLCIVDWSDARTYDAAPSPYVPTLASWLYTAPEVMQGAAIDDRADVFSLGVIAFHMLTGTPYTRDAMPDALGALIARAPDAPRELQAVIAQMLCVDRYDRPAAAEVRADLAWLADQIASAPVVRIRRPRWTPAVSFHTPPSMVVDRSAFDPDDPT